MFCRLRKLKVDTPKTNKKVKTRETENEKREKKRGILSIKNYNCVLMKGTVTQKKKTDIKINRQRETDRQRLRDRKGVTEFERRR